MQKSYTHKLIYGELYDGSKKREKKLYFVHYLVLDHRKKTQRL
jgi:hypothetical protein